MKKSSPPNHWRKATSNQSRYVLAELSGIGTYMIPMGHLIEGSFDQEKFFQAANSMVKRHDALRTRFKIEGGLVRASVSSDPTFHFSLVQPEDDSIDAFRQLALPLIFNDVNPLEDGSLVRIIAADYGDSWRFSIAAHHSITDGFSRGVMNKELLKLYAGEDLTTARSYYDFACEHLVATDLSDDARSYVDELPKPVRLVGDSIGQGEGSDQGQFVDYDMGNLGSSVRKSCKSVGATKFGLFAAIYALGVYGFSGSTSVTSFFQTEGRKSLGAPNSVVGPFSNTVPLDLEVTLDSDVASFAREISDRTKQIIELETEPGLLDAVLSEEKGPSVSINLFPPASPIRAGDLIVGNREFLDRRTEFDLNLVWAEDRSVLTARAFYDQSHLSRDRVLLFLEQQERLLRAALENPNMTCRQILSTARQDRPAALPQSSLEPSPKERLHQPFFATAERSPELIAIRTMKEEISYGQLQQEVRRVVASLQAAGLRQTDVVAIYAERSPALVAAMLGVSATGASFALLDASYPTSRCSQMVEDLNARFLLEVGQTAPKALTELVQTVPMTASPNAAQVVDGPPRRAACHMFTSGTTGKPKLITHPDTTLQRFVNWQAGKMDLGAPINTMLMSGLAHDPTLRDIFLPLCHAGVVTIPTPCQLQDPKALRALFDASACNVVRFSPTTARLLMMGADQNQTFSNIRGIFWGGERLPQSVLRDWQTYAPNARQFHVFGTTETPQAFLLHEINETSFDGRDIPIGLPLPWTGARLVDEEGCTVSVGEVGEIVAELADPIQGTNQKYELAQTDSVCQHFTGDLGYQRADGNVCFIGRRDNQIKINGFRVELREIEVTVEQLQGRLRSRAFFRDDRLVVFVQDSSETFTSVEIKSEIARRLPKYMVPDQVVVVSSFPATPNGKLDEEALIALAKHEQVSRSAPSMTEPEGEDEQEIAAIFAKATGAANVYREATLADLGADSLATIETRLALEAKGFDLPKQWEWMPVHSLAHHRGNSKDASQQTVLGMQLQNVDTFIILRSIAIAIVVIIHTGQDIGVGASVTLIAIAGFSFGRLHLPAILKDGSVGRIWALMLKLLVPLVPASLVIYFAHLYFAGAPYNDPHISTILLYENVAQFIETDVLKEAQPKYHVVWLWFLHVYLQIFLLLGLALSVPALRSIAAKDPWRVALVSFGSSFVLAVGVIQCADAILGIGDFEYTAWRLQFSPTTILPFFLIGLLCSLAETSKRQAVSFALALGFLISTQFVFNTHSEVSWLVALFLCTFLAYCPVPKLVKSVAMLLSVNALMIYLSHQMVYSVINDPSTGGLPFLLLVIIQLAFGVLLGTAVRPLIERLGINNLARKRQPT